MIRRKASVDSATPITFPKTTTLLDYITTTAEPINFQSERAAVDLTTPDTAPVTNYEAPVAVDPAPVLAAAPLPAVAEVGILTPPLYLVLHGLFSHFRLIYVD